MIRHIFFASLLVIASSIKAQDKELNVVELKPSFYMIWGGGGNMLLYNNDNGPILIDDSFAPIYPELAAIIQDKCQQEVKYLINTHWHGDHTGGNTELGKLEELQIIAHDAVRERLKNGGLIEFFNNEMPPASPEALPDITFNSGLTIHFDDTQVELIHFEHAHTDGDIVVHFPDANVIHLGDIYFSGQFPYLDHSSGGSFRGLIAALQQILLIIDDETIVIPGHGKASNKAELATQLDMIEQVYALVSTMYAQGKSKEEIANAPLLLEMDKIWNKGFITNETLTQLMLLDFQK